jgi:hypothetical protein
MKRVTLHIDRLVLRGFRPEDQHGIAEGLQQELGRMLADPQVARRLTAGGDVATLTIGGVKIGRHSAPRDVGVRLAQGIDKGIKR